jgi:para-nitrobenzyl esterase
LSYLFHQNELTPAQRQISDLMIGYWTNFAATGDPNGGELPPWPVYRPGQPWVMRLDADHVQASDDFATRHKCKFWAELGFGVLAGPYPTPTASGPEYR